MCVDDGSGRDEVKAASMAVCWVILSLAAGAADSSGLLKDASAPSEDRWDGVVKYYSSKNGVAAESYWFQVFNVSSRCSDDIITCGYRSFFQHVIGDMKVVVLILFCVILLFQSSAFIFWVESIIAPNGTMI